MAVTVEPADALPEYQRRYGNLHNDLLIRDVAIAKLEQENTDLRAQLLAATASGHSPQNDVRPGPHDGAGAV